MTRKHDARAALLAMLCLVFVPKMLAQACYKQTPQDQYCCLGTEHCHAHCVVIYGCDDTDAIGEEFCSGSYGLCCDDQYETDRPSGQVCRGGPAYKHRAVRVENEGMVSAEMVLVPSACWMRRSSGAGERNRNADSTIDDLR